MHYLHVQAKRQSFRDSSGVSSVLIHGRKRLKNIKLVQLVTIKFRTQTQRRDGSSPKE